MSMAPVGVLVIDTNLRTTVHINWEARRMLDGLLAQGESTENLLDLVTFRRTDGQTIFSNNVVCKHTGDDSELLREEELELSVPDGRQLKVLANAMSIRSNDGATGALIITMQDLRTLYEMCSCRTELVNMISHELRAPLASIKGSTSTVLDAPFRLDQEEILQLFRIIDTYADYMQGRISDLSDISRLGTSNISIDTEPLRVSDSIEQARDTFLSSGNKHTLSIELPPGLPRVMADRRRLVQVLSNLILTAARHLPPKCPIRVDAVHEGNHVAISVTREVSNVALGSRVTDVSEAMSLRLAFCKVLVEAQGGTIQIVDDSSSQCTRCVFTIPIAAQAADHTITDDSGLSNQQLVDVDASKNARILVVDDDPHMLHFIRSNLALQGFVPIVTDNHLDIPTLIQKQKPQLILLDLILPNIDATRLMNYIHEITNLPIIIISGYGRDETVSRALDAGATDYIIKPFSAMVLTARIRAALRKRSKSAKYTLRDLTIDPEERRVTLSGHPVQVTAKEYDVLRVLSSRPGRVFTFNALIRMVWGNGRRSHRALVRTVIMKLRRKLDVDPAYPSYIQNVHGVGYRMAKPDEQ